MRKFAPIITILLLTTLLSAQTPSAVIPIIEDNGGVIGGVKAGKWVKAETFAPSMTGNQEYRLVDWVDGGTGELWRGGKPEAAVPCEDYYQAELEPKTGTGIALGAAATWNPVPRVPVAISLTDATYATIVSSIVRAHGIARPKVGIKQIYSVDLDGDGTNEVILAATYRKSDGLSPNAVAGEYSLLLVRKLVGGKVRNILVASEFHRRAVKFGAISEFTIDAIGDLNGDGKMEVVMGSSYYEGNGSVVYEIPGAVAKEVLSTGCGV
ncbi:MAG: FG-GAP repeat protein [Pyrinomonadaceae bacterium]